MTDQSTMSDLNVYIKLVGETPDSVTAASVVLDDEGALLLMDADDVICAEYAASDWREFTVTKP